MPEAEQQLTSILKVSPGEVRALNLLGTVRGSQGRLDEAEELFAKAIHLDARFVGAHMNLAYLYMLKGASEKTIAELKEVVLLDPDNPDAARKLARLLADQNRTDETIGFIENMKGTLRKPGPVGVPLLVALGDAYLSKSLADKAEENYRLALGKQADSAEALLGLLQVAQTQGDAASASTYLARVRPLVSGSPELLYRFAMIALEGNRLSDALPALTEAAKLRPSQPVYFLALGDAWLKKPDLFEAEQAFRRALELQPGNAQGQMYLGYALLKQKKYPEARTYLRKSIMADPNRPEALYYLGVASQEENQDQQAVEIMEGLVRRFPSFASAHIALGIAAMRMRDYPRAKEELELAVKLDPAEGKAHYNLAVLYARLKEPQRAQEEMRIVEKLKIGNKAASDSELFTPRLPQP